MDEEQETNKYHEHHRHHEQSQRWGQPGMTSLPQPCTPESTDGHHLKQGFALMTHWSNKRKWCYKDQYTIPGQEGWTLWRRKTRIQ